MKKVLFILVLIIAVACQQENTTAATDSIKASPAYQEYVDAFNDYQSCKQERPAITTAYMNKKLTPQEFEKALEKNAKLCGLKKQVFDTRWKILQAEYEKLSEEYQIKEN